MRHVAILALIVFSTISANGQSDKFPLTAKVISSSIEEAPPITKGPDSKRTLAIYETVVTAEIENRVYRLAGGSRLPLVDPGEYPASLDDHTVRFLLKDKNGNPKIAKLHVISVQAKQ
jgi:hypothetical protein